MAEFNGGINRFEESKPKWVTKPLSSLIISAIKRRFRVRDLAIDELRKSFKTYIS